MARIDDAAGGCCWHRTVAAAAHQADRVSGYGSGGDGSLLTLVAAVRVEDEIGAQGEPALLPRLAARLQQKIAAHYRRSLHRNLHVRVITTY